MVHLRNGKVYLNKDLFNEHIVKFNTFSEKFLQKYSFLKNLSKSELKPEHKILCDKFNEILKYNQTLKLQVGHRNRQFFVYKKKRHYITDEKNNKNDYLRKELYEKLWILTSVFKKKYEHMLNSNKNYIKSIKLSENNNSCMVCYGIIKKGDIVNLCENSKLKHPYHKKCFEQLLKYQTPKFTVDIFQNKLYECTYCKVGINSKELFIIK